MQSSLNQWYFANDECKNNVTHFLSNLNTLSNSQCHPLFDNPKAVNGVDSYQKLLDWCTPQNIAILNLDLNKDLDATIHAAEIDLIVDIRTHFLAYIRSIVNLKNLNTKQAIQLFVMIYKYKVLFAHTQYGLGGLYKAIVRKLLELFYFHGVIPLFLIFCDLCPTMVTEHLYPLCRKPRANLVQDYLEFIETDPVLFQLLKKHELKFNYCLLPQLQ